MTDDGPRLVEVTKVDKVAVVRFHNLNSVVSESELGQFESLNLELLTVAKPEPLAVILDFEGREFAPCHAFQQILIRLHKKLGDGLKLCNLPPMVMEHFEISGLADLLTIYSTREAALAAVKNIDCGT